MVLVLVLRVRSQSASEAPLSRCECTKHGECIGWFCILGATKGDWAGVWYAERGVFTEAAALRPFGNGSCCEDMLGRAESGDCEGSTT